MINGHDRCHISTSHTLLISTVINKGVCSLQRSPVGGYPQLPPLPTFLSLLPSNFLNSFSHLPFFVIFFHLLQDSSRSCVSAVSMFFCLHFCHHRFHLYIFLFISVAAQSFISVFAFSCIYLSFSPTACCFSLSVSISVSLHFPLPNLNFFRLFPSLYFTCFNFASLWSFFYCVS